MKFTIIQCALSCVLGISFLQVTQLYSDTLKSTLTDDCSQEVLRAYFPEKFVQATLKKFNVPEDQWPAIIDGLKNREKDVEKAVEIKAAKMSPNPLKDPQQRQAGVRLFKEALYEIGSDAFKANGIQEESQIRDMLADIQQQKMKQFAECMERHKLPSMPHPKQLDVDK